jgi:hypothetical protein
MKSMPLAVAVSGIKSRIIRSRTHVPVALKACLLLPLRRAIATILSVRVRGALPRRKVFIEAVTENVAKVGRFYEHLQKAMQEPWDTYTDAELKLLLRFANQGYQTMLAATEQLKAMTQAPKAKPSSKPAKAP